MHPSPRFYVRGLLLLGMSAFVQWSFAEGLSDAPKQNLPAAFDAGWEGQKTCEILYELDSVRVGRCSFAPGVGHEKHFHRPHFGYVLEGGTMRIRDEAGAEKVVQTTAGKSWSSDKITVHEVLNIGDTTTSYLVIEPKVEAVETE